MTKSAPNAIESNARRGRPRNDRIHQLILNTALDLAFEVGFRGLSVEAIAAKAGVGKTTIYRRWPNKGAVVMDAFLSIVGPKTSFPSRDRAIESIQLQMRTQVKAFRNPISDAYAGGLYHSMIEGYGTSRHPVRASLCTIILCTLLRSLDRATDLAPPLPGQAWRRPR